MENLLHLFAIMNMGEHLAEALEEKMITYQSEFNGKTPLMIADEAQNELAMSEIYKCFEINPDMFMTMEDLFILLK
jgi:acyl-CoA reductase-like NAD-dependent aldehyde dehydrogenase